MTKLTRQIKFQKARKFYLNPKSETHLKAEQSLVKAGYTPITARQYATYLFKPDPKLGTPPLRLDPQDMKGVVEELNKWLVLMSNWREALEKVENPLELKPSTYAVISAHIERLAKIFGFIRDQAKGDTNIRVNIINLSMPQQYQELKTLVKPLMERIRKFEDEMNVDAASRFRFN